MYYRRLIGVAVVLREVNGRPDLPDSSPTTLKTRAYPRKTIPLMRLRGSASVFAAADGSRGPNVHYW